MAAQGNLTLNTKVYNPRGKTGDIAKWALVGDTTFGGGTSTVTESVRDPSGKDATSRIRFHLDFPKLASDDSACACTGSVLGTGSCDVYVTIPSVFTAAERADVRARIQSLVADAVFTAAIDNLEGSW